MPSQLVAGLLPLRAFSTNFSPEPADKLDTVRVPVVGAPSQSSEFAGSYTAEVAEGNRGSQRAGEQRGERDGAQRPRNARLQRLARPPASLFPSASSAVAMRYLEPVAEYDEAGAVTDPECNCAEAHGRTRGALSAWPPERQTGLTFGYLRYTECAARKRSPTNAERILHSRRSGKRAATASSSRSSASTAGSRPSPAASSAS